MHEYSKKSKDVLRRAAEIIEGNSLISIHPKGSSFTASVKIRRSFWDEPEFMHLHFGGYYNKQVTVDGREWWWHNLQGARAYSFLKMVLPYLKRKKEVAELMLQFHETIVNNKKRKLTLDLILARNEIIKRINQINRDHLKEDDAHWVIV
jgi:hypothetical protein